MFAKIASTAFVLASGTIAGQIFVVAASPFLTRLYGPTEFGLLGTYTAILYVISSVSALRYETAIPLVKQESEAESLMAASICIVLLSALLSGLGVLTLRKTVSPDIARIFGWALPIGVVTLGLYNVAFYRRLRSNDHGLIAKTRVLQAIGGASVQIGLGIAGLGGAGLVIGQIVGVSAGLSRLKDLPILRTIRKCDWREAIAQLKVYKNFPKYGAPASIISIANTHAPTIAIALLFTPTAAGLYALVQRVLITPFGMVSSALSASLFSHARSFVDKDSDAYAERLLSLATVLSPVVTIGALIANASFHFIFGEKWASSGLVAAWVILFLAQKFIFDSAFSVLTISSRQKSGFYLQGGIFLARLAVLIGAATFAEFPIALFAFSVVTTLSYFCAAHVGFRRRGSTRPLQLATGAVDCIFPYLVVHAALSGIWSTFASVCVSYVLWAGCRVWSFARDLRKVSSQNADCEVK
ncbi:oligosaccharide flippase family protein [Variovorax sp. J22R133]|uniref:lipopolysaccharide biosynthesis protein n=1 Tax=Variovorax brevis TaxID=3053503 RepID=UPI0025754B7F|nr:oligosaccharide flippase family protein [Variovorax sp. J22R133]MDM0110726.1 oligosaccharide flippase family protein [Variovorax sp. J22R133]